MEAEETRLVLQLGQFHLPFYQTYIFKSAHVITCLCNRYMLFAIIFKLRNFIIYHPIRLEIYHYIPIITQLCYIKYTPTSTFQPLTLHMVIFQPHTFSLSHFAQTMLVAWGACVLAKR